MKYQNLMLVIHSGLQDPRAYDTKQTVGDINVYLVTYISVVEVNEWKCLSCLVVAHSTVKIYLIARGYFVDNRAYFFVLLHVKLSQSFAANTITA